jgi:hypothetical protein
MRIVACFVVLLCAGLTGCESLSDAAGSVRAKFTARDEGRTKPFAATTRVTYEAVRGAARAMDFRFVRGGAAQGELEAVSNVGAGETQHSARQVGMKVKLHASADGGTDVTVRFTEILESDSSNRPGMATEATMRDTPLYEVFFRSVQQALDAQRAQGGPAQNKS